MENCKFSIVSPTYNRSDYLSQMIESILRQNYSNWELIVVSDGSTDSTHILMEYYTNKDKRIKFIDREINKGIAYTRNEGNSHATGDWIVVMDSDDIMIEDRLYLTNKYINKYPEIDFVYGGLYWMSEEANWVKEYWKPKMVTGKLLKEGNQVITHGASAYRRSVAEQVPYRNNKKINDDFWFVVDCWNAEVKFGILDRPLIGYRVLHTGVSHINHDKIQKEMKINLKKENIRNG